MAIITSERHIAPQPWNVSPGRLGKVGQRLWYALVAGYIPSWGWGLEDVRAAAGPVHRRLSLVGSATIDARGLVTSAAGDGAQLTLPADLKSIVPLSMVWIGYALGTLDNNAHIFGMPYDNADGTPFAANLIYVDGSKNLNCGYNTAGTFRTSALSVGLATTSIQVVSSSVYRGPGETHGIIGRDTDKSTDGSTFAVNTLPNYSATSLLSIGSHTGVSRNANMVTMAAYVFFSTLSSADIAELAADPFAPVRRESRRHTSFVKKPADLASSGARSYVAGMIGYAGARSAAKVDVHWSTAYIASTARHQRPDPGPARPFYRPATHPVAGPFCRLRVAEPWSSCNPACQSAARESIAHRRAAPGARPQLEPVLGPPLRGHPRGHGDRRLGHPVAVESPRTDDDRARHR